MTERITDGDTPIDPFEERFTYFSGSGDYATVYLNELETLCTTLSEQEAEIERWKQVAAIEGDLAEWWETAARFLAAKYDVPTEVMQEALGARPAGEVVAEIRAMREDVT